MRNSTLLSRIQCVPMVPFATGLSTHGCKQIYGTDEKLYGYQDLLIDVSAC